MSDRSQRPSYDKLLKRLKKVEACCCTSQLKHETIPITSNGQTIFNLVTPITDPIETTQLFVNGQKMEQTVDYTLNGAGTILTWTDASFALDTTDVLEIYSI